MGDISLQQRRLAQNHVALGDAAAQPGPLKELAGAQRRLPRRGRLSIAQRERRPTEVRHRQPHLVLLLGKEPVGLFQRLGRRGAAVAVGQRHRLVQPEVGRLPGHAGGLKDRARLPRPLQRLAPQVERQVGIAAVHVHVSDVRHTVQSGIRFTGAIESDQSALIIPLGKVQVGQIKVNLGRCACHPLRFEIGARFPEHGFGLAKVVQLGQHVGVVHVDHRQMPGIPHGREEVARLSVTGACILEAPQADKNIAPVHRHLAQGQPIPGGAKDVRSPIRQCQRLLVEPQIPHRANLAYSNMGRLEFQSQGAEKRSGPLVQIEGRLVLVQ